MRDGKFTLKNVNWRDDCSPDECYHLSNGMVVKKYTVLLCVEKLMGEDPTAYVEGNHVEALCMSILGV